MPDTKGLKMSGILIPKYRGKSGKKSRKITDFQGLMQERTKYGGKWLIFGYTEATNLTFIRWRKQLKLALNLKALLN